MISSKVDIWQVNVNMIEEYDKIPMLVYVKSILKPTKINNGLGGITFVETPVEKEYVKDLGLYENHATTVKTFNTKNWAFFIAFADNVPIGGVIVAGKTRGLDMLAGRDDLGILWDLRVRDGYQFKGVGTQLWERAVSWCKEKGYKQMKIECQNNNVRACNFYASRGAILSEYNEYAYYNEKELRDEIQFIWYFDL